MKAEFTLPQPPSVNGYWRSFRGRQILSAKGRAYKVESKKLIAEQGVPCFGKQKLKVHIVLRPRDKRRCDLDNYLKALLDAMQGADIYEDDCQIDHLEIVRGEPVKGGSVSITLETFPDPPRVET